MTATDTDGNDDPGSRPASQAWQWAALLPALGLSLATFLVDVPPFPDVPFHLASAEIRAGFETVPAFSQYYSLYDAFGPNSLFHTLAAASGHPRVAMPALLAFSTIGSVLMLIALGRRSRAGPVFALVAGLFAVNFNVTWGFLEFVLGIPLLLALVWLLGYTPPPDVGPRRTRALALWTVALASLLLVIFVAHAILCIFALAVLCAYVLLTALRGRAIVVRRRGPHVAVAHFSLIALRSWGQAALAAATAVPTGLLILYWKAGRTGDPSGFWWMFGYYRRRWLAEMSRRSLDFFTADHGKLISYWGGIAVATTVVFAATLAITLCFLAGRRRARDPAATPPPAGPMNAARALALASVGVCLVAPPGYPPFWFVYQRFFFTLFIGVALWAAAGATRRFAPRPLVYGLAVLNLALGALWFEHVYSFGRTAHDLAELSRGAKVSGVGAYAVNETDYRGEPEAFVHADDLMTAIGHLPVQSDLYDYPYARVRRGPGLGTAIPKEKPNYKSVAQVLAHFDGFGWMLLHRSASPTVLDVPALAAVADLVGQRGEWTIYARRPNATTRPAMTNPPTNPPTTAPALQPVTETVP